MAFRDENGLIYLQTKQMMWSLYGMKACPAAHKGQASLTGLWFGHKQFCFSFVLLSAK